MLVLLLLWQHFSSVWRSIVIDKVQQVSFITSCNKVTWHCITGKYKFNLRSGSSLQYTIWRQPIFFLLNPRQRLEEHEANFRYLISNQHDLFLFSQHFLTQYGSLITNSSKKYPSKSKLINADRIDELNQQLINQTDGQYRKGYIQGFTVNFNPGKYYRFALYYIMTSVYEDFQNCFKKFKVRCG